MVGVGRGPGCEGLWVRVLRGEAVFILGPPSSFPVCFVLLPWFESRSCWNGARRVVSNSPVFQVALSTRSWSRRRCSAGGRVGNCWQRVLVFSMAWMASL